MMLKVFLAKGFVGHWPVGTAAVVVANDVDEAIRVLNKELENKGIGPATSDDFFDTELDLENVNAVVLCDGDY